MRHGNICESGLKATWDGDKKLVAETIAKSQQDYASIINFHDENALLSLSGTAQQRQL